MNVTKNLAYDLSFAIVKSVALSYVLIVCLIKLNYAIFMVSSSYAIDVIFTLVLLMIANVSVAIILLPVGALGAFAKRVLAGRPIPTYLLIVITLLLDWDFFAGAFWIPRFSLLHPKYIDAIIDASYYVFFLSLIFFVVIYIFRSNSIIIPSKITSIAQTLERMLAVIFAIAYVSSTAFLISYDVIYPDYGSPETY